MTLPVFAAAIGVAAALAAPSAMAGGEDYKITLTDGVVAPQVLDVAAGETFALTVTNTGSTPAEFESKSLHIEQVLAPGASNTFQLRGLDAGVYKFVEEFHEDLPTGRGVINAK